MTLILILIMSEGMFDAVPLAEVTDFVKKQRNIGNYRASSAKNMLAAVALVQEILTPDENSVAFVRDHVDDLFKRYQNLNPKVGHQSLIAYRSRLSRAVKDYVAHRSGRRASTSSGATRKSEPTARKGKRVQSDPQLSAETLRHRFPLRPGFDAEVVLPRDFSTAEAKRITQWIHALAFEDEAK